MRKILVATFALTSLATDIAALEYSGRLNTWTLYETDDIDSTTVAVVYDTTVTPPREMGVVVGRDIQRECSIAGRSCSYRKIGSGGELTLERVTDSGTEKLGKIGGDALLYNLGVSAQAKEDAYTGKINGNFTTSLRDTHTLLGGDQYRFHFYDLYVGYKGNDYRMSLGRKSLDSGVTFDGVTADVFFGPTNALETKTLGFFGGLAPDPITNSFSKNYATFGPTLHLIPEFASQGESKFVLDSALVFATYKSSVDRFYLNTRAHFTPKKQVSLLLLSTLELPWKGDDGGIKSSHLSLQSFWRPNRKWFFSAGVSQFRIERHLQEEAIRWVTDTGSRQTDRVGTTLDRSHRYRLDVRSSYRPIEWVQPFVRARYERRTIDSTKQFDNSNPPLADLTLIGRENAYQGTGGFKLFIGDHLETETSGTYSRRFQSKGYDGFQYVGWDSGNLWTADTYFQYVTSARTIDNSVTGVEGSRESAVDFYAGIGGSYRFLSDFLVQIRYDFGNEDDKYLDKRIQIHTALVRLDWSF